MKVLRAGLPLGACLVLIPPLSGCGAGEREGAEPAPVEAGWFVDGAAEAGLDFRHHNGMSGELYFVEPVGSGGALVDLDGDGDLDVVLVQGGALGEPDQTAADSSLRESAVYRNDTRGGDGGDATLRLVDVTASSGLRADGYGMGVATGDVDGDGRTDLYFTNFGSNQLWRNVSDGDGIRFEDVTSSAGVDDARWSTSASFADLDLDGHLDLFVVNYVDYTLASHRSCRSPGGRPDYCGPQSFSGETDSLFLNRGDGTFEDVSGRAGILDSASSGLGVVVADFDGDGLPDVYVANDLRRNALWRNQGVDDGVPRFENIALESGAALSMAGQAQASMGVVAADFDEDGDEDLFMTHLRSDHNTLYVNDGDALFLDRSAASGLAGPSLATTGFGVAALDVDNDGWLDLAVANGAVKVIEEQASRGEPYPLRQPDQLFMGLGGGLFEERSAEAGPDLQRLGVSRGAIGGDVDNDGRADLLLTDNHGPARLLMNDNHSARTNDWIGLRVLVGEGGRDALGARVLVRRPDGTTLHRRVASDGSYLSASDPRVLVGLGPGVDTVEVEVSFPGGAAEVWSGLATGRYHELVRGAGSGSS